MIDDDDDVMNSKETTPEAALKQINILGENSSTPMIGGNENMDEIKNIPALDPLTVSPEIRTKLRKLERLESKYQGPTYIYIYILRH